MIIAFNFFSIDERGEKENFIFKIFHRNSTSHLENTFILISNKPYPDTLVFSKNVIPVVKGPLAKHPAQWLIWYNIKIPSVLKKYKADVFISFDFCSLTTKVPQCIIINDLSFLAYPSKNHLFFYKKFTPRSLKKTKAIVTVSEFSKADIIKQYKIDADKIKVVYNGIDETFEPINFEERKNIKEKYADGNEYFIYTGELQEKNNLLNLLKAFSAFKKRQKSNMQLLIAGNAGSQYEELLENLRLFRFKEEVKLLIDISHDELVKVTAATYAMVYPSFYEGFPKPIIEAMKCGVPVLTSSTSAMPEICGDAALYFDPKDFKEIAVKMMLIFKDENLRKKLIEKGNIQVEKYSWNITSQLLWESIEKIMQLYK